MVDRIIDEAQQDQLNKEVLMLEASIKEIKSRLPAHSPKVEMLMEIDELEYSLETKRALLADLDNGGS